MTPMTISISQSTSNTSSVSGSLYGSGTTAVILSNMDTNDQREWEPVVEALASGPHMVVTYDYPGFSLDQSHILEAVISHVASMGATRFLLAGASRGGVASLKVASRRPHDEKIVGVAALSAPIEHEGSVFYTAEELKAIAVPKLLVNSEGDDGAADNHRMLTLFNAPKTLAIYPGDGHGTQIFDEHKEAAVEALVSFINRAFSA
ncbi:alpha/beta fold hydrolase [Desulfoluna butyratoxydans]|uniref:Alpha/beta hydrolase fold n=1 Tax=Desulfoluna butyratoxydans TaxID=231438 RepID=A0A4U8YHT5_9BACT|nr:alpha/beta hydrolase [Desulfoluna butyratoxydans]VFQ42807.1 alpha/beta hydrolase fold [Desulfoluna butyratoxydans]